MRNAKNDTSGADDIQVLTRRRRFIRFVLIVNHTSSRSARRIPSIAHASR
ncbi:MAG TPA: hypothetical protein VHX44_10125 [Planctomycetota bacterium]|nr:hypothetical protein [Planctomycetota bacterium]